MIGGRETGRGGGGVPSELTLATCWSLEQLAKQGGEMAGRLAFLGALPVLRQQYIEARDERQQAQAKAALKAVIVNCGSLDALTPLVAEETPAEVHASRGRRKGWPCSDGSAGVCASGVERVLAGC